MVILLKIIMLFFIFFLLFVMGICVLITWPNLGHKTVTLDDPHPFCDVEPDSLTWKKGFQPGESARICEQCARRVRLRSMLKDT